MFRSPDGTSTANESVVRRESEVRLPTRYGQFTLVAYTAPPSPAPHLALVKGEIDAAVPVLVRMHSECMTGDLLHSLRCDCGEQMEASLRLISARPLGVFLYLRQEGRGIGLLNKLQAYRLQDEGMDTIEANRCLGFDDDPRDYGVGVQILRDLGIKRVELITNNPRKIRGLEDEGIEVVRRLPLEVRPNSNNARYLRTKKARLGHLLQSV